MTRKRPRKFSPFYFARLAAGFNTRESAAEFLGLSVRTIRTYDAQGAPRPVMLLLDWMSGDLGALWPEWRGWRITREALKGPRRAVMTRTAMEGYPAYVDHAEREIWRMRRLERWPIVRLSMFLRDWLRR